MKLAVLLPALGGLAACAHGLGEDTPAAGPTADVQSARSLEAPAPRRHHGKLGRGGGGSRAARVRIAAFTSAAPVNAELERLRAERKAERAWVLGRNSPVTGMDGALWGPWNPEGLDVIRTPVASHNVSTDTVHGPALH